VSEAVVFDALGTLFDLERARRALVDVGAPPQALEAWFERVLHQGTSLTLVEDFRPLRELAPGALRTTLAQAGVDPAHAEPLDALAELEPYPDAEEALRILYDAGVPVVVLTNGGEEDTRGLLERGGLRAYVDAVLSVDEAEAFKPHPAPYAMALYLLQRKPSTVAFVAAHAWDCAGARARGMRPIWVDRLERDWPLPQPEPERVGSLVEAARLALS
jgi:2-haloacid dehalogenase